MCLTTLLCKSVGTLNGMDIKKKGRQNTSGDKIAQRHESGSPGQKVTRWQNAEQLLFWKAPPEPTHPEADAKPSRGVSPRPLGTVELSASLPLDGSVGWFLVGRWGRMHQSARVCVLLRATRTYKHVSPSAGAHVGMSETWPVNFYRLTVIALLRSSAVCTQQPSGECLYRGCHKKEKKKTERKLCWEKAGSRISRTHNKRLEIYDKEQDPEHWFVLNDAAPSACLNWFYCHTSIGGTLPSFTSPQMIQTFFFFSFQCRLFDRYVDRRWRWDCFNGASEFVQLCLGQQEIQKVWDAWQRRNTSKKHLWAK